MVSINLIPETVQRARALRSRINRWAVSVLAAGAVMAIPLCLEWYRRAEADELRMRSEQLQTQLASVRADLQTLNAQANQALVRLERAKALRSKRAWSAMFAMIGRAMPSGCWLTSVATDPATPKQGVVHRSSAPRARATGGHPALALGARISGAVSTRSPADGSAPSAPLVIDAPRELKIAGYATDAAEPHQFITNLKAAGVFSRVALERTHREPALGGSYFRFELVCEW